MKDEQRIDWASSLLIAHFRSEGVVSLDELAFDGETIVAGVNTALEIWEAQSALCRSAGAEFRPCRFGETIAVSPGLVESADAVEGIRYKSSAPRSGWWLSLPGYEGEADDFRSMTPMHVFHVLQARRDLARYLGLPAGYAFDQATDAVWRDVEAVSDQER